jgi:hypothetical protein
MRFYEVEIQEKIFDLPDDIKKEVLDYVEYLYKKYKIDAVNERQDENKSNPFLKIRGFCKIGAMNSEEIDKEVYGL